MKETKMVHSSVKAVEWGVSNIYVEFLCKNKHILGAEMRGSSWYLPSTTPKPASLPSKSPKTVRSSCGGRKPFKSPKTVRSSYGGSDTSGFGGKRFVFSIIALLLILIAFIISINGDAKFVNFTEDKHFIYSTYTINCVIWGATNVSYYFNPLFHPSEGIIFIESNPINFLCVVLAISLIIGIAAVIFAKHESMNLAYFAFAIFLLFAAIAMFSCKNSIESIFRQIKDLRFEDEFAVEYGGPIATGIFLLLSSASMVVAGILTNE